MALIMPGSEPPESNISWKMASRSLVWFSGGIASCCSTADDVHCYVPPVLLATANSSHSVGHIQIALSRADRRWTVFVPIQLTMSRMSMRVRAGRRGGEDLRDSFESFAICSSPRDQPYPLRRVPEGRISRIEDQRTGRELTRH